MTSIPSNSLAYTDHSIGAFLLNYNPVVDRKKLSHNLEGTSLSSSIDNRAIKYVPFTQEQKNRFEILKEDKFLNKRFIVHLFGDSFMKNSIYEGWFISDALMHVITILKENEISEDVSRVLSDLTHCLSWHSKVLTYTWSSVVDDYEIEEYLAEEEQETEEVDEELQKETNHLVEELKKKLTSLQVGEKFLSPGGCRGHAVLYEIKRVDETNYLFAVYNAGDGAERHMTMTEGEGVRKVYGVYRLHNVKIDKLIEGPFLESLFKLREEECDFGVRLYEEILPMLEGDKDEVPTDPNEYMGIQRSGTCVWKMFSAYLRYNLPLIESKYLKLKARLDVFQKWYDLGYPLDCIRISQSLLGKLIVNYKHEIYGGGLAPVNFSREELLAMGIYKAQKTFNKYKVLLSDQEIKKAETWFEAFTGQSIHTT